MENYLHNPWTLIELQSVVRVVFAAMFGMLMGLQRTLANKHAGMRTYALVSMGSALFAIVGTLASYQQRDFFTDINPLQIAGSIVIGIGFIGSGLGLIQHGESRAELTTAAGIWAAAGVGMACGFGFYILALSASLLTVLLLALIKVENKLRRRYGIPTDS